MPEVVIAGIPVNFPYDPYDVQVAYMEKVITCLRDGSNGVLESPTGTGKTLSLLCSALAWILSRKKEMQAQIQKQQQAQPPGSGGVAYASQEELLAAAAGGGGRRNNWSMPKIIYASRTHSQLTQAMQELKRTSYAFMRAVVLGSRDQLCIHPEVAREQGNANKIAMCKLRVQSKACSFQMRVEQRKDHPDFRGPTIMDIEDLVQVGQKLKMCPYYSAKELVADADITFMPYNYLLDPKARKANKVELNNTIVILDEAHNIEKICEESASVQIRSSDVAMAIDDVTHVMKTMTGGPDAYDFGSAGGDEPKDFNLEDLALLKEMLLDLERAIDEIVVANKTEGTTFPAAYIFDLLAKANFNPSTAGVAVNLLEKLLQFLAVASQNSAFRKGRSFELLADLLSVVFVNKEETMHKVYRSFKVHVQIEEAKKQSGKYEANAGKDGWLSKPSTSANASSKAGKIINYWCFNPGFGMEQLLNKNVRSVILTSGTLAPLKPLIAELAIPVRNYLENPHIVSRSQVYVKIIGSGPDREQLISNYNNRDNPKYISSLGQTILNVSRIVPDGLLVFFPSYPLLNQCVNAWQASGLWADVSKHKPIYVEPRSKDEFTTTMEQFYQSINDGRGACFMAVCRGKVSEGLDFADRNGRAVIITGLPFPPLKDPKVILKRRYLDDNRTKENELLSGQEWYGLEATRAVNQAIGRVIRHRNDYGAILLCDSRFQQPSQVQQLSKWLRSYLGAQPRSSPFGPVVRELREFFKSAEKMTPAPKARTIESLVQESCEEAGIVRSPHFANPKATLEAKSKFSEFNKTAIKVEKTNSIESWSPDDYKNATGGRVAAHAMDFMSRLDSNVATIDFNSSCCGASGSSGSSGLVSIHKRERISPTPTPTACSGGDDAHSSSSKRAKRYKLIGNDTTTAFVKQEIKMENANDDDDDVIIKEEPIETIVIDEERKVASEEERLHFLRTLRHILLEPKFEEFTKAVFAYKRDGNLRSLCRVLFRLLDGPEHLHLLQDMRRYVQNEHKAQYDEELEKQQFKCSPP